MHKSRRGVRLTIFFAESSWDKEIGTIIFFNCALEFCDLPIVYGI